MKSAKMAVGRCNRLTVLILRHKQDCAGDSGSHRRIPSTKLARHPGHCCWIRRKPALPPGIVTVVVVWLPPEGMPLERVVKLAAASVGEVSTAYVAPGMEVQVSVK